MSPPKIQLGVWGSTGGNATAYSFGQQRSISRTAEIKYF